MTHVAAPRPNFRHGSGVDTRYLIDDALLPNGIIGPKCRVLVLTGVVRGFVYIAAMGIGDSVNSVWS